MGPVLEALLVVVIHDVLDLEALLPGVGQALLLALEVVLHVALRACEGAHLLARGLLVDVVVLDALAGLEGGDALEEARAGHAQAHRLGVVAVDARDRVGHVLDRLAIGHLVDDLEALDQVAVAGLLVGHVDRGVAMQTGAGLLGGVLALGEDLVFEHVGVAALLAEVLREGVARPHDLEARILFQPRLRDHRAGVRLGGGARHGLGPAVLGAGLVDGAHVAVVLEREVAAPDGGVHGLVGQLDHLLEGGAGLVLALGDVHEQGDDAGRDERRQGHGAHQRPPVAPTPARRLGGRGGIRAHGVPLLAARRAAGGGMADAAVAADA
ncbi:hypothetical protein D3C72_1122740 [compost metagenome]